jgi:hypothetical protein
MRMAKLTPATWTVVLLAAPAICISPPRKNQAPPTGSKINKTQGGSPTGGYALKSDAPVCKISGKKEITIECDYTAAPPLAPKQITAPRIVLNHLLVSFNPREESHMLVVMTLANEGVAQIPDGYAAYLAIDDDAGQNYVRRVLQHFDFRKLPPSQRSTFSDRLLVGSFRPGHYLIRLWIPSPDPLLKFTAGQNLLLSNLGTSDPATGLNTLATFVVMPEGGK